MCGCWLVAVGGGWWFAVWWPLAAVGGLRFGGGWQRLAVGVGWRLAVGCPWGLSLRAVLTKKKDLGS